MEKQGTEGEEREVVDFAPLARIPAGAHASECVSTWMDLCTVYIHRGPSLER